jgi:hypothetical protein
VSHFVVRARIPLTSAGLDDEKIMKYCSDKTVRLGGWVTGCLVAASLLAGIQMVPAAVLASYQFTGNSLASSDAELNSTAGSFATGSGITAGFSTTGNPGSSRFARGSTTGTTLSAVDYFAFTVSASPQYQLNLNGFTLTFDAQNVDGSVGNQSANWAVRTSVLGFNTDVGAGTFNETAFTAQTTSFNGATYDGLTSFEVRIYMWDPNASGQTRFDNFTLNGSVVPVPEPVHYALGIFGLGFAGFRVRRHYCARRRIV